MICAGVTRGFTGLRFRGRFVNELHLRRDEKAGGAAHAVRDPWRGDVLDLARAEGQLAECRQLLGRAVRRDGRQVRDLIRHADDSAAWEDLA